MSLFIGRRMELREIVSQKALTIVLDTNFVLPVLLALFVSSTDIGMNHTTHMLYNSTLLALKYDFF